MKNKFTTIFILSFIFISAFYSCNKNEGSIDTIQKLDTLSFSGSYIYYRDTLIDFDTISLGNEQAIYRDSIIYVKGTVVVDTIIYIDSIVSDEIVVDRDTIIKRDTIISKTYESIVDRGMRVKKRLEPIEVYTKTDTTISDFVLINTGDYDAYFKYSDTHNNYFDIVDGDEFILHPKEEKAISLKFAQLDTIKQGIILDNIEFKVNNEKYSFYSSARLKVFHYELLKDENGIKLYKRYGSNNYVQEIDVKKVDISFAYEYTKQAECEDGYSLHCNEASIGNPNPFFVPKTVAKHWEDQSDETTISMINAQFFSYNTDTGYAISFPVKQDGKLISAGFGNNESHTKHVLGIFDNYVVIDDYTNKSNSYEDVDNALKEYNTAIVCLDRFANVKAKYEVNRTNVGVGDFDDDGVNEILFLYSAESQNLYQVDKSLRKCFGANKTMIFDGGGSTQLVMENKYLVESARRVPMVMTVGTIRD